MLTTDGVLFLHVLYVTQRSNLSKEFCGVSDVKVSLNYKMISRIARVKHQYIYNRSLHWHHNFPHQHNTIFKKLKLKLKILFFSPKQNPILISLSFFFLFPFFFFLDKTEAFDFFQSSHMFTQKHCLNKKTKILILYF